MKQPSIPALRPVNWLSLMAPTNCARAPKSNPFRVVRESAKAENESLSSIHPTAGRDVATNAGHSAVRHYRVSPAAAVGAAGSGLSHYPGRYSLSRREPGRNDFVDHRSAGAPVRPDAGSQSDVFHELGWRVGNHAAIQPRVEPRCGRAGSTGGYQRGRKLAPHGSAHTADL